MRLRRIDRALLSRARTRHRLNPTPTVRPSGNPPLLSNESTWPGRSHRGRGTSQWKGPLRLTGAAARGTIPRPSQKGGGRRNTFSVSAPERPRSNDTNLRHPYLHERGSRPRRFSFPRRVLYSPLRRWRVVARAEADLEDIAYYIAKESASLETARRVIESITDRFHLLAANPYAGRARDDDLGPGRRSFPADGTSSSTASPAGTCLSCVWLRAVGTSRRCSTIERGRGGKGPGCRRRHPRCCGPGRTRRALHGITP
jgi:plasmid stabilization system protein ParE